MRSCHRIIVPECQARPYNCSFLSDTTVVSTGDRPLFEEPSTRLLEQSNPQHPAVCFRLLRFRKGHLILGSCA